MLTLIIDEAVHWVLLLWKYSPIKRKLVLVFRLHPRQLCDVFRRGIQRKYSHTLFCYCPCQLWLIYYPKKLVYVFNNERIWKNRLNPLLYGRNLEDCFVCVCFQTFLILMFFPTYQKGGFIQMVFVIAGIGMGIYNSWSLKLQLANQLYSFEEIKDLTHEDKDITKFNTKQEFLESIFGKIGKKIQNLTLGLSYFFYNLSFF